jgi:hypothetical protein
MIFRRPLFDEVRILAKLPPGNLNLRRGLQQLPLGSEFSVRRQILLPRPGKTHPEGEHGDEHQPNRESDSRQKAAPAFSHLSKASMREAGELPAIISSLLLTEKWCRD